MEKFLSPKQQRRPLPLLLSLSFFFYALPPSQFPNPSQISTCLYKLMSSHKGQCYFTHLYITQTQITPSNKNDQCVKTGKLKTKTSRAWNVVLCRLTQNSTRPGETPNNMSRIHAFSLLSILLFPLPTPPPLLPPCPFFFNQRVCIRTNSKLKYS